MKDSSGGGGGVGGGDGGVGEEAQTNFRGSIESVESERRKKSEASNWGTGGEMNVVCICCCGTVVSVELHRSTLVIILGQLISI